jgi:RNA polymerase sigma-70 factor (ECF subfamily)
MSPRRDFANALDPEVVSLALQGDEAAYAELVHRYQKPVQSLLYHLLHDRDAAEELTQETFLRMHLALDRYDPTQKFSTWLFRIANNLGVDQLRARRLETVPLEQEPADVTPPPGAKAALANPVSDSTPSTGAQAEAQALTKEVRQAIRKLSGNYRRCFVMRHFEEMSFDHIAETLNMTPSTVRSFVSRAESQLREMIDSPSDSSRDSSSRTPA